MRNNVSKAWYNNTFLSMAPKLCGNRSSVLYCCFEPHFEVYFGTDGMYIGVDRISQKVNNGDILV